MILLRHMKEILLVECDHRQNQNQCFVFFHQNNGVYSEKNSIRSLKESNLLLGHKATSQSPNPHTLLGQLLGGVTSLCTYGRSGRGGGEHHFMWEMQGMLGLVVCGAWDTTSWVAKVLTSLKQFLNIVCIFILSLFI